MADDPQRSRRLRTRQVRGGLDRSKFCETAEALYLTSGYVYDSAEEAEESFDGRRNRYVYSRFKNPTIRTFEVRLTGMEEGAVDCRATASGMAAVFAALMCMLKTGDRVVSSRALFSSCAYIVADYLPRFGITSVLVDGTDLDQWAAALAVPTAAVFLETPSNPTLQIVDLPKVCELAHQAGALVIVDNVLASPILQHPLTLGADVVCYSATKHIDGQGRTLGGAVLVKDQVWMDEKLAMFLRQTGPALSPFNAWVHLKGLETLDLRMERHCENALAVARFLEAHPAIARVFYPGLPSHPQHELAMRQMSHGGSVIAFEIAVPPPENPRERTYRFLDALRLIDISNNLGDAKSLITHPLTTTHQRLSADEKARQGITEELVRLSVGLEDVADLIEDLGEALTA
ncbi:MAG: O-succinylhomoserine sulfhydrylase [Alphaproteobacteria bacterium]|nr:O-succinylhomoserine sulfhydrylase [Alphaproteobacteria bacterium]